MPARKRRASARQSAKGKKPTVSKKKKMNDGSPAKVMVAASDNKPSKQAMSSLEEAFSTPRMDVAKSQPQSQDSQAVVWDEQVWDEDSQDGWGQDSQMGDDDNGGWGSLEDEVMGEAETIENMADHIKHEMEAGTSLHSLRAAPSYRFLTQEEALQRLQGIISQMADELFITPSEALLLLLPYSFFARKATNDWFDDSDKLRAKYSIADPSLPPSTTTATSSTSSSSSSSSSSSRSDGGGELVQCCTAMCDMVQRSEAYSLACGHWFCKPCMSGYLEFVLEEGPACVNATCPAMKCDDPKCEHPVSAVCKCKQGIAAADFQANLSEEQFAMYQKWLVKLFVRRSKDLEECPSCSLVCHSDNTGDNMITCECKHRYCFNCLREAHAPVPCDLIQKFYELDSDDISTQKMLMATTKQCPKCQVRISKNKQCNHMRCTQCNHQFCWLCKGDWSEHGSATGGYYKCNIHTEQVREATMNDEEKSMILEQQRMAKYAFSVSKLESGKKSVKQLRELLAKDSVMDLEFGTEINSLCEMHTVLRFTFCLSYFIQGSSIKEVFCMQQDNVQKLVLELTSLFLTSLADDLVVKKLEIRTKMRSLVKLVSRLEDAVNGSSLVNQMKSTADEKVESWGCTNCGATYDSASNIKSCTKCKACRLHGELDCLGSECTTRTRSHMYD
jgi:hypothetical protein